MKVNQFRVQVIDALAYLDDPSQLHQEVKWHRAGTRGTLHSNSNCHKLDRWNVQTISLSVAQAAKKKTCSNCASRALSSNTFMVAVQSVATLAGILATGSAHLKTGTMSGIGEALSYYDDYRSTLSAISKDDAKSVAKALRVLKSSSAAFAVSLNEATNAAIGNAPAWAASAISRKMVSDSETNIPDVDECDIRLYGENTDSSKDNEYMLSRIYLRWHRKRTQGREFATTAAMELLQQASFASVNQLNFAVNPPKESILLEKWAKEMWQTETQTRLLNRLIPAWDKRYMDLVAKTEIKLVGVGCESLRSKAGRALVHAYPVCHHNGFVLALVPEVIAQYILGAEKKWYSDVVEVVDACSADVLDTVATFWDPYNAQSTFQKLSDAAAAANRL